MFECQWKIICSTLIFVFCVLGYFYPLCVRSPLDTLESGVLFHIWWLPIHLLVLHDKSTMESSVVFSLPDSAFTPTLASTGWNDQL